MTDGSKEATVEICGHKCHPRYRNVNKSITACVRTPGHTDGHVYCIKVAESGALGKRGHALQFYEETEGRAMKSLVFMDLKGPVIQNDEIAALWQYMELVKQCRKKRGK